MSFIPPDLNPARIFFEHSKVFTKSVLNFEISAAYEMSKNSKILITVPEHSSESYLDQVDPLECQGVAPFTEVLDCSYDQTSKKITINNFFSADVGGNQSVKFSIKSIYTPISTSKMNGYQIQITDASSRVYLKRNDTSVHVESPQILQGLQIAQEDYRVDESGSLTFIISISSLPINQLKRVEISASGDIDLSEAFPTIGGDVVEKSKSRIDFDLSSKNDPLTITIQNAKNGPLTNSASFKLALYNDKDEKIAETTSESITFTPNVINQGMITFNPPHLGRSSTAIVTFSTSSFYKANTFIEVDFPTEFKRPTSGTINCSSNLGQSVTCQETTSPTIKFSGVLTSEKNAGLFVNVTLSNLTIPQCPQSFSVPIRTISNENLIINQGEGQFSDAILVPTPIKISSINSTSHKIGATSDLTISFSSPAVISKDSILEITLHNEIQQIGSTECKPNFGFSDGSQCIKDSNTGAFKITGGFSEDKKSDSPLTIIIENISNPRFLGNNFEIKISIFVSEGVCKYAEGSINYEITEVNKLVVSEIFPTVVFQNVYSPYKVKIQPSTEVWDDNDYITIQLPEEVTFSQKVACRKLSTQIESISCSRSSESELKVFLQVDSSSFVSLRLLEFEVSFVQNANQSTPVTGFKIELSNSNNQLLEESEAIRFIYSDEISPDSSEVSFATNKKGEDSETTITFKVSTFIPQGSIFVVRFGNGQKFNFDGKETIKESVPKMRIVKVETKQARWRRMLQSAQKDAHHSANNQMQSYLGGAPVNQLGQTARGPSIQLSTDVDHNPNSPISIVLKMANPTSNIVSGSDIIVDLFIMERKVFSKDFLNDRQSFICQVNCATCDKLFSQCTTCDSGFVKFENGCVDPKDAKNSIWGLGIPFLFTCIYLSIGVVLMFLQCLFFKRTFVWNYYFSLVRIVYVFALVGMVLQFFLNKDSHVNTIILAIALPLHIAFSLVESLLFWRLSRSKKYGYALIQGQKQLRNLEALKFLKSIGAKLDEKSVGDQAKKSAKGIETTCLYRIQTILTPIFGCQILRTRFSCSLNSNKDSISSKGYFWFWHQTSFNNLRWFFMRHYIAYLIFEILVLVFVCYTLTSNFYVFKIDLVIITILDLVIYLMACQELHPSQIQGIFVKRNGNIGDIGHEISKEQDGSFQDSILDVAEEADSADFINREKVATIGNLDIGIASEDVAAKKKNRLLKNTNGGLHGVRGRVNQSISEENDKQSESSEPDFASSSQPAYQQIRMPIKTTGGVTKKKDLDEYYDGKYKNNQAFKTVSSREKREKRNPHDEKLINTLVKDKLERDAKERYDQLKIRKQKEQIKRLQRQILVAKRKKGEKKQNNFLGEFNE